MNIVNIRRAIQVLDAKVKRLEGNRRKAKNTVKWDKKNGTSLMIAKSMRRRLASKLLVALQEQGQFEHPDWYTYTGGASSYG